MAIWDLVKPAKRSNTLPASTPQHMQVPTWNGSPEEAIFGEYNTLPNSVNQADVEAIAQQDEFLKEGVKRLEKYATHAKSVTESLVKAHEIRADYLQHVMGCVEQLHKANADVYKRGLKHQLKLDEVYDALGISQARFRGNQQARNGFGEARQKWRV